MDFKAVDNAEKLTIYKHSQSRLESDLLLLLVSHGIVPADFDSTSFMPEKDDGGNIPVWQSDVKKLIDGLSYVKSVIDTLEE